MQQNYPTTSRLSQYSVQVAGPGPTFDLEQPVSAQVEKKALLLSAFVAEYSLPFRLVPDRIDLSQSLSDNSSS